MTITEQPIRATGWEQALAHVYERHAAIPGEWGVSDCWVMALDAIEAVTGARMFAGLRKYRAEKAGYRLFAKRGFTTVEEAFASELTRVGPLVAMRGDVGVIERDGLISAGFFDAEGFAVKTLYGDAKHVVRAETTHFPVTLVKAAFKVGR